MPRVAGPRAILEFVTESVSAAPVVRTRQLIRNRPARIGNTEAVAVSMVDLLDSWMLGENIHFRWAIV